MRFAITAALIASVAFAGPAHAAHPSEAELSVVGEACQQEGARTLLAYRGRESGIAESAFISQLPPVTVTSPRYVVAAHRIVEDVYRLRDLSDDTLYFYRFQVCRVESVTGVTIETTRGMEKALRACESQGIGNKDALQACTFKAVLAASPG